jgi:hypothetical protein
MEEADQYRCRLINLKPNDDPDHQAEAACEALANIDGILLAAPFSKHSVHIIYALDSLTFEIIIELLTELNFELQDSILVTLRNTISCYLEDNARANMHLDITEFQESEGESQEVTPDSNKYWEDYR